MLLDVRRYDPARVYGPPVKRRSEERKRAGPARPAQPSVPVRKPVRTLSLSLSLSLCVCVCVCVCVTTAGSTSGVCSPGGGQEGSRGEGETEKGTD